MPTSYENVDRAYAAYKAWLKTSTPQERDLSFARSNPLASLDGLYLKYRAAAAKNPYFRCTEVKWLNRSEKFGDQIVEVEYLRYVRGIELIYLKDHRKRYNRAKKPDLYPDIINYGFIRYE